MATRRFEKTTDARTLYWEVRQQDRFVCLSWGEMHGTRKQLDRNCGSAEASTIYRARRVLGVKLPLG